MSQGGFRKSTYGVTAYCTDEDDKLTVIAVVARSFGITFGCERPTTLAQCRVLLEKIATSD